MVKNDKNVKSDKEVTMSNFRADKDLKPMSLKTAVEEYGIGGDIRKAKDMLDIAFYLVGAKEFMGKENMDGTAFFCDCIDPEDKTEYSMVIGGQQPSEFIQSYIDSGAITPLHAKLKWVTGGKFGGYYTLVDPSAE